jgi:oxalate---CoA ligase
VVQREGASVSGRAIRDCAASRLANFKVPRKVIFLTGIPKGATGKPRRIGFAEKLGLTGDGE